jgi:site-specific DNA recombinase
MKSQRNSEQAEIKYCAAYIRVSTMDQAERYSLPSQLKALRAKAARDGKTIREDWIFKDKHTGKLESRPDFDRLNALVETGAPDTVYVFDVSRFARKTLDALKLTAKFKKHGVKLDFCETPYADTAAGRLGFTQMAAVAEFLGEKLIEDSKRGQREKLEQGLLTHGSAPYGYKYIDKRQPNGSRFEIDDRDSSVPGLSRVQVVRDIFDWRRSGMPTYRIAKRLHEMGVLSAGRAGRGGIWTRQGVLKLLGNSTYIGRHTVGGMVVPCPALIDESLWKEVQRINKETREKYTGRPPKGRYLLRSLLFCGKCARRCLGHSSHARYYYRCGNLLRVPYIRRCDAPEVVAGAIETAAWSAIWQLLKDPALLLQMARTFYESMVTPEGDSTGTLEHERERLTERIKITRQMMRDSAIGYAEGLVAIRDDEKRIRQIEAELAAAGRVVSLPPLHAAQAAVREIVTGPEPTTYEHRRAILDGILDLRMTYYNRDLTIEGKIPVPAPAAVSGGEKKCNKGVGAVGGYLSWACHDSDLARERSGLCGVGR